MKQFEINTNKENLEKSILNEWDKKILLEGSKNVIDKILAEFRGKLPDGIIFPETSARPLAYLFDPIFTKISKEQNKKKPTIFFMKTVHPDTHTSIFEDQEGRELYFDEVKEMILEHVKGSEGLEPFENYLLSKAQDTSIKRAYEEQRSTEIKEYSEDMSGRGIISNLAVIDDFTNQGETAREINHAFGYEIPYFSIFGRTIKDNVPEDHIGLNIDIDTFPKNPSNDNNTKLSYAIGGLKKSIGVNKNNNQDNLYSEVNKDQTLDDRKMMATLRKEMKELGVQIASQY